MKKRFKSNIMLLVVFVMFVTSLLGLLVTHYVKDMIKVSSLFTKYYTTYFHAYGGLEMGLSLINYRVENNQDKQNPFGYEDSVTYSGYNNCNSLSCGYDVDIHSRGSIVTDSYDTITSCTGALLSGGAYTIDAGGGFIVPLFYDVSTGFSTVDYEVIDGELAGEFVDLSPQLYNDYEGPTPPSPEDYIVRIIDEEVLNYNNLIEPQVATGMQPEALASSGLIPYESQEVSPQNKNYLVVANSTGSTKQFCLQLDGTGPSGGSAELAGKYMIVESLAEFAGISVAFNAIKTNELPSYLIYGTINP